MRIRTAFAALLLLGAMGCRTEPTAEQIPNAADHDAQPALAERRAEFLAMLEEQQGSWVERDGVRICEGYLTRFEDEDYCASRVPDDWEAFEFDGQTYYVQPLEGDDESTGR